MAVPVSELKCSTCGADLSWAVDVQEGAVTKLRKGSIFCRNCDQPNDFEELIVRG